MWRAAPVVLGLLFGGLPTARAILSPWYGSWFMQNGQGQHTYEQWGEDPDPETDEATTYDFYSTDYGFGTFLEGDAHIMYDWMWTPANGWQSAS